jgi:hypothetical protein
MQIIGRRIRLGLIGGGPGSIIGETHRIAARLDGMFDIVASALSSNPQRSRQAGLDLGIASDRAYGSWPEMLEAEAQRADRVDAVAIMTPNDSHYEICMAALNARFHVRVPSHRSPLPAGASRPAYLIGASSTTSASWSRRSSKKSGCESGSMTVANSSPSDFSLSS